VYVLPFECCGTLISALALKENVCLQARSKFAIAAVRRKLTHSMWPLQPFVDIHDVLMASNTVGAVVRPVRLCSEAAWNQLRYIQRIDEMERIIRFLLEELTKARISICRLQRFIAIHFKIESDLYGFMSIHVQRVYKYRFVEHFSGLGEPILFLSSKLSQTIIPEYMSIICRRCYMPK